MIFDLHNIHSNHQGFSALGDLAAKTIALEYSKVEICFEKVRWFDANMAAPLGAVIARIADRYNLVSVVEIPSTLSILHRNGFLAAIGAPSQSLPSETVLPYVRFRKHDTNRFYDYLDEHLPGKGLPDMSSDFALRFQQSLGEIFVNADTHSESELGVFVCGQFYPTKQRLDISMADAGITIPGRVKKRFGIPMPDAIALKWALVEGNTTKEGTPGGVGLELLRKFVSENGGKLQIASGCAFWEFHEGKEKLLPLTNPFPGTVVNLEVFTGDDKVYGLN